MGGFWICGLSLLTCVLSVVGGGGYPAEDLITKLPGQPEVSFRQFAGYVDVDLKNGKSMFYYFVEADVNPNEKSLTLWLNGGPGCSSVGGGGFTELGPFFPQGDGLGLRKNSKSWNKASNMLFVESPAGVGWSYSNTTSDYDTGDVSTAQDMLRFMVGWFKKFPKFKSRKLFLSGESYAGHYIPQLAMALLDFNALSKGFKFNLAGILIGNPLLRSSVDFEGKIDFLWSHGLISHEAWHTVKKNCHSEDYLNVPYLKAPTACSIAKDAVEHSISEYIDQYDVLLDVCYPGIVQQQLRLHKWATKISVGVDVCITYERRYYFNLPEVQKALHANRTNLPYQWSMCSDLLSYRSEDGDIDILPLLKRLIQNKIPVWVYSGDVDTVLPLVGTRRLVFELARDLNLNTTIAYGAWFHEHQVGGWNIEYGKLLTFASVRGGGHMVPLSQPSRALKLFASFVKERALPNSTLPLID